VITKRTVVSGPLKLRSMEPIERDIALLRHIQELTQAGVGLSGVERILELEHQLTPFSGRSS